MDNDAGKGGNGGKIFIIAQKKLDLKEGSRLNADGGDGSIGGKGGEIHLVTPGESHIQGEVSAKGGRSFHNPKRSLLLEIIVGVVIVIVGGLLLYYVFGIGG